MPKISAQPYQCKMIGVELDLTDSTSKAPEQWRKVRLLFVRGNAEPDKKKAGKHNWAVCVCNNIIL